MTTLEQRVNPDPVVVAGFIGGLLRGWQWVAGTGTGAGTGGETTAHSAQNVPQPQAAKCRIANACPRKLRLTTRLTPSVLL